MNLATVMIFSQVCMAQASVPLPQLVDQSITAFTDAEFVVAEELVRGAIAGLPARPQAVEPSELAVLWQVLGAIGVHDGRPGLVTEGFGAACGVDGAHFEERLGSMARNQWEAACRNVEPTARLLVLSLPADSALFLDGTLRPEPELALSPGPHLVQVVQEGTVVFARALTLETGQAAQVDTGLAVATERTGVSPLLLGSGAAAATGLGMGVVAAMRDHQLAAGMEEGSYTDRQTLLHDYVTMTRLRSAALILGGAGTVGLTVHFVIR